MLPAALGLFVAAALLEPGCSDGGSSRTLHVVWSTDVPNLDPNSRFDFSTETVSGNVFEPLVRYDRQMTFTPCLAKSWEVRDGSVWRFHLRDGVLFQDGSTLTAEDVASSIQRLQKLPDRDIHRYVAAITEVRVIDPLTVDVVSERPAGVLAVLSFVYILPKRALERDEEAFFRAPAGTGPYRIVEWRKGVSLRLEAHEDYWGGRPAVPTVVFRVVADDDGMWTEARRLAPSIVFSPTRSTWAAHRKDDGFVLLERPGLAVHFLTLRVGGGPSNPLSDVRVRRALRAALDYRRLVSVVPAEGAFPASQFVPPAIVGFNPALSVPTFVPGEAKRLLAEAGFRQERPLRFLVAEGGGPLITEVVDAFEAAGVRVAVETAAPEELDRRSRTCDADLFFSGWICSTGDAGELFEGNFSRRSSHPNPCGYGSDEMDAAIDEIGRTLDPEVRRNLLQRAMARLVDDLPWIPLLVSYDRHALTPGVEWQTRADGQLDLRDVRLK